METLAHGLDAQFKGLQHETQLHVLDAGLSVGSPASKMRRLRSLREALRGFDPDIVISHSALPNLYARLAARPGTPIIVVLHSAQDDFVDPELRLAEFALSSRTSALVAVSPELLQRYLNRFPRMTPFARVIPNGIANDITMREGKSSRSVRMIAVSRFAPMKRLDLLLTALPQVLRSLRSHSISLDIIGTGSMQYVRELEELVRRDRLLATHVRLLGQRADVHGLLGEYDLFLHASRAEGHSLALLEASAAGLPVVISDAVANSVDPRVVKTIFSQDDALSLETSIRSSILGLDKLQDRASRIAPTIRHIYSLTACAERYVSLCENLVSRTPPLAC
jgi:glycosyltransferase involved in cell wall biosynthesis